MGDEKCPSTINHFSKYRSTLISSRAYHRLSPLYSFYLLIFYFLKAVFFSVVEAIITIFDEQLSALWSSSSDIRSFLVRTLFWSVQFRLKQKRYFIKVVVKKKRNNQILLTSCSPRCCIFPWFLLFWNFKQSYQFTKVCGEMFWFVLV